MYPAVTVAQMRDAEASAIADVGADALMQRAAAGLANVVGRELRARTGRVYGARVLVLAGPGNNGGDGLFAGVRLARRGVRVDVCATAEQVHERGWAALLAAGARTVSLGEIRMRLAVDAERIRSWLASYDLVIDAILGIGGRPGLRPPLDSLAAEIVASGTPVVACDLPSGLSADLPFEAKPNHHAARSRSIQNFQDGSCDFAQDDDSHGSVNPRVGHLPADVTVTFGERKLCHVVEPARSACGRVEVVDIGLGRAPADVLAWEPSDVAAAWPVPGAVAHKYSRGVVAVDTGSQRYPGAAVLSVLGAVHAGAGLVRFAGPDALAPRVIDAAPNVVVGDGRADARLLGCGWGERAYGAGVVAAAVASGVPLVVDADALRCLPARLHPDVLLTPHAGELARLLGCDRAEIERDPLAAVRAAVERFDATVLLKGATQLVQTPGTPTAVAVPGPAWTAQAGSGDVLAGMCGALLAAGLRPAQAALTAASVQALTAAAHPGPVPPQELAREFAGTVTALVT